jgi:hypothetical protein
MTHILGAKEPHSFVANPLRIYGYAYDTEVDPFFCNLSRDIRSHSKLMLKLK